MTTTCSKIYRDIPFAHRQHRHDGHCRFVHGHNWAIEVTFEAEVRDQCNFVIDFGKLGGLKRWIENVLDHRLLIAKDDPQLPTFREHDGRLWQLTLVPDGSAEGLAEFIHAEFNRMVAHDSNGRVRVLSVRIWEDSKDYATAHRDYLV